MRTRYTNARQEKTMSDKSVSFTVFIDFVTATGISRLTKARNAKKQAEEDYDPKTDFYKPLRDTIIQMHEEGKGKSVLNDFLEGPIYPRKLGHYRDCIQSYIKWMGRKNFEWSGCTTVHWKHGDIDIRVTPELGLRINGQEHLVKLHFKPPELSKRQIECLLHLMHVTKPKSKKTCTVGILDIRRAKLITPTRQIPGIDAWLQGEASAMSTMWDQVEI